MPEIFFEDFNRFNLDLLENPFIVIGNLPYYCSTAIISKFIDNKKKLFIKDSYCNIRNLKLLILLSEKINKNFYLNKNILKKIFLNIAFTSVESKNINKL